MLNRRQAMIGYVVYYLALKPFAKRALRRTRGPLLISAALAGAAFLAARILNSGSEELEE